MKDEVEKLPLSAPSRKDSYTRTYKYVQQNTPTDAHRQTHKHTSRVKEGEEYIKKEHYIWCVMTVRTNQFLKSASFSMCMFVSSQTDLNIWLEVLEPNELWLPKQISCHFLQTRLWPHTLYIYIHIEIQREKRETDIFPQYTPHCTHACVLNHIRSHIIAWRCSYEDVALQTVPFESRQEQKTNPACSQ